MNKKYGVILCDPPWEYRNTGTNGAAEKHYPTMATDDLCALPVASLAANDSVLVLWATWPLLPDAMRLIAAWGFQYITGFPWVKLSEPATVDLFGELQMNLSFGTGFWVRGCTELILISRRGNATRPDQPFAGLVSERFQHSRKPTNVHQYCESMPGPWCELFARRPYAGWDVFGNEVESTITLEAA